jgi:hypothetical protein
MFMLSPQPPVPTSLTDIPPPNQTSLPEVILEKDLPNDVISNPLYAYIYQPKTGYWENYNRVGLKLTEKGEWKLLAEATITPETPFHEETTIEEGIVSTVSVERCFSKVAAGESPPRKVPQDDDDLESLQLRKCVSIYPISIL